MYKRELKIGIHSFDVKGSKVYCMLLDDQIDTMKEFFKRIEEGSSWEDAKKEVIDKLIDIEYPGIPDHVRKHYHESSSYVFVELEKQQGIQDLIKSIDRDINLGKLLD